MNPELLFSLQATLIGGLLLLIFQTHSRLIQLQILIWTIAVVAIVWRFGVVYQNLDFYSNDQWYYVRIVQRFIDEPSKLLDSYSWESLKLPYTGPAYLLALMGIHPALALKTVSLICLIMLSSAVLQELQSNSNLTDVRTLYMTGCGGIGVFFSTLALRETMMMLFVLLFLKQKTLVYQVALLVLIFMLRSHLALSLVFAWIVVTLWNRWQASKRFGVFGALVLIAIGSLIGKLALTLQITTLTNVDISVFTDWGTRDVVKLVSNFFGLQFLTNEDENINFSIPLLLALRLVFTETIVIPSLFILRTINYHKSLSGAHQLVLIAFSFYTAIAINTNFNSFRQNIPIISCMGLIALESRLSSKRLRKVRQSQGAA